MRTHFFASPVGFLVRQLYKLLVVLPYQVLLRLYESLFRPRRALRALTPYCFIISSVIYALPDKKVSHGGIRSTFNPEERARQTAQTIASIRRFAPEATIVLIEGGRQTALPHNLEKLADQYVYAGASRWVRLACDSTTKSLGEVAILLYGMSRLRWQADYYFKISGRYQLTPHFKTQDWKDGALTFYSLRADFLSTRLYGIPGALFYRWRHALLAGLPLNLIDYAVENTLLKTIPSRLRRTLARVGVTGVSASTNEVIEE